MNPYFCERKMYLKGEQTVEGVVNLYKPPGITSHDAVKKVQRMTGARKAGHAGTLDPSAEGVLLVCLGRATRITEYLMGLTKVYTLKFVPGISTDTFDSEGRVLERRPVPDIEAGDLERLLERFIGEIEQVPPAYSALKKGGVPLYRLARRGEKVELKPRMVRIYSIKLLDFSRTEVSLEVECSKGTYIRSLVNDIGRAMGCGATLTWLRRDRVGRFSCKDAQGFEDIAGGRVEVIEMSEALSHLPVLELDEQEAEMAGHGQIFHPDRGCAHEGRIRVISRGKGFVGTGICLPDGRLKMEKVFV